MGLKNPNKKKKFKESVELGGLGEGFWDFLDHVEEVVGDKELIEKGEHVKLIDKYKYNPHKFENEDKLEDEVMESDQLEENEEEGEE